MMVSFPGAPQGATDVQPCGIVPSTVVSCAVASAIAATPARHSSFGQSRLVAGDPSAREEPRTTLRAWNDHCLSSGFNAFLTSSALTSAGWLRMCLLDVTLVEMSSAATDTWNAPASSFATSSTLAHWKVVVTYVVCASASAAVCGKVRLRCPVTTLKKSNSGKLCPLTVSFAVTTAPPDTPLSSHAL